MMKLSAVILKDELAQYVIMWKFGEQSDCLNLRRPEHYIDQIHLKNGHTYLARAEMLLERVSMEEGACLISIGSPPEQLLEQKGSLFVVSGSMNSLIFFNVLHSIFEKYDEWDECLQDCIRKNSGLQSLLKASEVVFENPISVVNREYDILATTREFEDELQAREIPPEQLNVFKQEDMYHTLYASDKPIIYTTSIHDYRNLAYIVKLDGNYILGISMDEILVPIRDSDFALFQHLADYIMAHYEKNESRDDSMSYVLSRYFTRMLEKEIIPEYELTEIMVKYQWSVEDFYIVWVVKLTDNERRYNFIQYFCSQIEKILSYSSVFEYDDKIVVVENISLEYEFDEKVEKFLRLMFNSSISVGESKVFRNIKDMPMGYIQAISALKTGFEKSSDVKLYKFKDYILPYILENCTKELKTEMLLHEGILKMAEYDRIHGTSYILTLKTWLDCKFNMTKASKQLFIHRSTFQDRLNRIQNYFHVTLDTTDNVLYIMICLSIIIPQIEDEMEL